jgi:hypothetical protein
MLANCCSRNIKTLLFSNINVVLTNSKRYFNKYPSDMWQRLWDDWTKEKLTHTFFPTLKDRISKRLQKSIKLSTFVNGHGILKSYFHIFKIIDDPKCLCKKSSQTADHLLWECELLGKQRQVLRNSIMKVGRNWPIKNFDLTNTYTNFFQKFVNTINFETLWTENLTKYF